MMLHDKEISITEQTTKQLVDTFYKKISLDPDLSPIFSKAIGQSYVDWEPHLEKMYAFWSSIMLKSKRYSGNPVKKHKELPPFDIKLFDQWLALFAETARDLYAPDIADQYIAKSLMIAQSLKYNIYN